MGRASVQWAPWPVVPAKHAKKTRRRPPTDREPTTTALSLSLSVPSHTEHTQTAMSRFIVPAFAALIVGANGECVVGGVGGGAGGVVGRGAKEKKSLDPPAQRACSARPLPVGKAGATGGATIGAAPATLLKCTGSFRATLSGGPARRRGSGPGGRGACKGGGEALPAARARAPHERRALLPTLLVSPHLLPPPPPFPARPLLQAAGWAVPG